MKLDIQRTLSELLRGEPSIYVCRIRYNPMLDAIIIAQQALDGIVSYRHILMSHLGRSSLPYSIISNAYKWLSLPRLHRSICQPWFYHSFSFLYSLFTCLSASAVVAAFHNIVFIDAITSYFLTGSAFNWVTQSLPICPWQFKSTSLFLVQNVSMRWTNKIKFLLILYSPFDSSDSHGISVVKSYLRT